MKQTIWYNRKFVRVISHLVFIALSYLVLLRIFTINDEPERVDHVYTILFLLTLLPVVYLNLNVLIPKFGKPQYWLWYLVSLAGITSIFIWINIHLFDDWSARLLPEYFFISYYTWWELLLFFLIFLAVTTLIRLSKSWFRLNEMQQQLLGVEKEKVSMELASLRSQINPHFFFNTLNNIYSLSLQNDPSLPGTVLKLADIMRYYLYESNVDLVPLEKEISILKDYIELQKIRSGQALDLKMNISGEVSNKKIAPLLLITFLENAFKHGAKGSHGKAFIHLDIKTEKNNFYFRLSNNKGSTDSTLPGAGGLGLENMKRRLELIYPGRHQFNISQTGDEFTVDLNIIL